jgi:hypothetical protein
MSDINNKKETHPADKFLLGKPETGKALIPDEIKTITEKTFKTQLTKRHYKGEKEIRDLKLVGQNEPVDLGLVAIWQSGDVEHFIKQTDLAKLKDQTPKVYVSQDKNIKLLLALTEQQQFKNEEKKTEASFTLKEYAKLRGYTEKEIKVGGKFLAELRRDLITGAYTTYRINEITINGKKYIAHGIPNFYILLEPKNPKDRWQVKFNTFYAESILKILKGEAKQYFTHYLKEVADRKTTEKPYLHFFYNQLIYRKQTGKTTIPKKVVNLLKEMGVAEKYLTQRPQECFNILKECLVYTTTKYPEELESIYFFNDFNKEKEKHLPLSSLKALEDFKYKDFKTLLEAIGVKDIREAFISFVRQKGAEKELPTPKPQDNSELIDQILEWVDRNIDWAKMTTLTREGTEQYLKDSLNYLGFDRLNELFKQEAQATYPNAVKFLTKTLPAEFKERQKRRGFKTQYKLNKYDDEKIKRFLDDFKGVD